MLVRKAGLANLYAASRELILDNWLTFLAKSQSQQPYVTFPHRCYNNRNTVYEIYSPGELSHVK